MYCHAAEVGHSKREYLEQASPVDVAAHAWQPKWLKWSVAIMRKGALTHDGIPTTQALTEDVAARLPGAPTADSDARVTPAGTAPTSSTACWSAVTRW